MDDNIEKSCDNQDNFISNSVLESHPEMRNLKIINNFRLNSVVESKVNLTEDKTCYDEHWKILCDFDYFDDLGESYLMSHK